MTSTDFHRILGVTTVRTVIGREGEGLFVQGVTQAELAELVTLAGRQLGAMPDEGATVNPDYSSSQPMELLTAPDVIQLGAAPTDGASDC